MRLLSVKCPNSECNLKCAPLALTGTVIRKGVYYRRIDRRVVRRFFCKICNRGFSAATRSVIFRQHRPDVNAPVRELLCSNVSQRRIAKMLSIDLKTVARKLVFLAGQAELRQKALLSSSMNAFAEVQFDELETFVHTKCKPLSVPIIVHKGSRFVLGFDVCSMPSKGPLAEISRKKYGVRKDDRALAAVNLMKSISHCLTSTPTVQSDENPKYPKWLKQGLKSLTHIKHPGKRGCITGQGELKKIGFDPLFDLNHTCAMLRANINRLIRKTWCTTKRIDRLKAHIMLYVDYHNHELI